MRVLALDSALARCSAAVVAADELVSGRVLDGARGQAASLPGLVEAVLAEAPGGLDLVAVTVGPGGFTGLRAALSLAHGLALARGIPAVGITVGEALADELGDLGGRALWVAVDSRRGQIFLERDGAVRAERLDALPPAPAPLAVAGDAAPELAEILAGRGTDVMLTEARLPLPLHVGRVGARRARGELPPRPAQPLYVDPPAVRLPTTGLRPPPA